MWTQRMFLSRMLRQNSFRKHWDWWRLKRLFQLARYHLACMAPSGLIETGVPLHCRGCVLMVLKCEVITCTRVVQSLVCRRARFGIWFSSAVIAVNWTSISGNVICLFLDLGLYLVLVWSFDYHHWGSGFRVLHSCTKIQVLILTRGFPAKIKHLLKYCNSEQLKTIRLWCVSHSKSG